MTAFSLLLTGCGVHMEDNKETQSVREGTSFFSEPSDSSDSLYFNRTYNSKLDYDGMILTLEEKGVENLSDQAKTAIKKVSFYNSTPYNFSWVELFRISDYYQAAYTNPNVATRVRNHQNGELYNVSKDSIYWDKLVDVIMTNSANRVKNDSELVALSSDDVKTIVKQFSAFSEDTKKEYPNYDMAHLACQLSSLSLAYRKNSDENSPLASTTYTSIEWYLNENGEYPILKTAIILNDHEFKHFLCSYCQDEINRGENIYITPSGVIYGSNTSLNLSFIEEATAEEYAAQRNGKEAVTYYEKIAALNTLRFVLSLQDDYVPDGFLKYGLLQNPLAIVQQFPVLDSQTYYFENNLKMLASYNACLSSAPYTFVSGVESIPGYQNFYENLEQRKEVFSSLGTYASSELSRLFLTNLIVMNDTKDSMTLEYNFYLLRLFEKRMQIMFSAMTDYQKFNMSSANYGQIYNERLGYFFSYLSERYQMDLGSIRKLYEEYSLKEGTNFPSFVNSSTANFYRMLETKEYDGEQLKENYEKAEQYYIQYSIR